MAKITPAQLRNETRIAVERIRGVIEKSMFSLSWSAIGHLRGAARTAREQFYDFASAETEGALEIARAAYDMEAMLEAALATYDEDSRTFSPLVNEALELARLRYLELCAVAEVEPFTWPQVPGLEHVH